MDSAAAYSMTLPDEGGPERAGIPFAARVTVSVADGRYSFSAYAIGGSGTVTFDFGDGTTQDVTFPDGVTTLEGEIVSDKSTPLVRHEYATDGTYVVKASGNLTRLDLAGHHQISGKTGMYDTGNVAVDETTALTALLRMSFMPTLNDMIGWATMETAVVESTSMTMQYPWFDYDSNGNITFLYEPWGPKKIVMRGLSGPWPFVAMGPSRMAMLALFNLEEFYAPHATAFDGADGRSSLTRPVFGACDALKVLYLPNVTHLYSQQFVSPLATGLKLYVGKLVAANIMAFGRDDAHSDFVSAGHCSLELFCKNTRQELLNISGFPFGAAYLKCHCTDVTFDTDGKFWRNSDGKMVDADGNLVDGRGRRVDESGHLVQYNEKTGTYTWCDEYGFFVDGNDKPYDIYTGFWIDRDLHVCDEHGMKCDSLGTLLSTTRVWNGYWTELEENQVAELSDHLWTGNGTVRSRWQDDPDDPRYDLYQAAGRDGYAYDYFDGSGYLNIREDSDGNLFRVEYSGDRNWYLIPLSTREETP